MSPLQLTPFPLHLVSICDAPIHGAAFCAQPTSPARLHKFRILSAFLSAADALLGHRELIRLVRSCKTLVLIPDLPSSAPAIQVRNSPSMCLTPGGGERCCGQGVCGDP
eukprot:733656-Rhodomonas_salina.1